MTGTDDVLDAIDAAVGDWTVSDDAMRVTSTSSRTITPPLPRTILVVDEAHRITEDDLLVFVEASAGITRAFGALSEAAELVAQSIARALAAQQWDAILHGSQMHVAIDARPTLHHVIGERVPDGQVRVPDRPLPLPRNHAGPPVGRIRPPRTIGPNR